MHPQLISRAVLLAVLPGTAAHDWATARVLLPAGLELVLAAAYYAIAWTLLYYYTKRPLAGQTGKVTVFVGFGLACGTAHALGAVSPWVVIPAARAAAQALATALAALSAVLLWKLVPRLLALPAPQDLQRANERLRAEVVLRSRVEHDLRGLQANLEAAVQQRTGELERARAELEREVAERRRMDQDKDALLRTVSHELRTPLSAIGASLQVLAGSLALSEGERADLAQIALHSTERLMRLVNSLLEIDGIQDGRLRMAMAPVSLERLAQTAVQELQPFAREQGVQLEGSGSGQRALVRGDADRLVQVLTNLVSNAVRYAPRGSSVAVRTEVDGALARVTVTDQGPGVPPDYRERVFEKFVQVPRQTAAPADGLGLGLSIGRAIVERHGGRIGVESHPGRETTFFFELPLLPERDPAPAEERGLPLAGPGD